MGFWRLLFTLLLPPVSVYTVTGPSGAFWLNLLLTFLGYLPGLIHALWVVRGR